MAPPLFPPRGAFGDEGIPPGLCDCGVTTRPLLVLLFAFGSVACARGTARHVEDDHRYFHTRAPVPGPEAIRKPLLYPPELRGHVSAFECSAYHESPPDLMIIPAPCAKLGG
jgi:hypothetical protein